MQREGEEGGIWVVAGSCHQTSEGIGLMGSLPAAVRCDNRYILLRVSMSLSGQKGMSPLGNFE